MDLKRRATRGAFWATVETWGNEALLFVIFAVLARLLGPEAYGLLGIALIVVLVGQTAILLGGWTEAIIQRPDLDPLHLDTVFWSVLGLAILLALIAWLSAPFMAWAFEAPELAQLLPWLGLAMPLAALSIVPLGCLQRELRFAPLALRWTLGVTVAGTVAIVMAFQGYGVWSLVAFELIHPAVAVIVFWAAESWRPRLRFSARHFQEIFSFSSRLAGERGVALGENLVPRVVIAWSLDPVAVGLWTLARKLFDFTVELVQRPITRVAMSTFSVAQAEPIRLIWMLGTALELTALAVIPGYLLLLLLGPDLVTTFFGPAWGPSGTVLQILAVAGFVTPAERLLNTLMLALGKPGQSLAIALAGFAVLILGMVALARWGLLGVAAAYGVRTVVVLGARAVAVRRLLKQSVMPLLRGVVPVIGAGALLVVAVLAAGRLLPQGLPPLIELALLLSAGAAGYLVGLALLARSLLARLLRLAKLGFTAAPVSAPPA
jgi:PST family polysaccharide transporter